MKGYGQFCPVAKTAEIFAERWTPLILRELCCGARRFSEFQAALPLISRALLAQRLRELEAAGIIDVQRSADGKGREYRITKSGEEFRPMIELMGLWGQRWAQGRISAEDLDPVQLVWGIRRHLDIRLLPKRRLVVQIEFRGIPKGLRAERYYWLVLQHPDAEVCQKNPGYPVDVTIRADLGSFTRTWMGHEGLAEAQRAGRIALAGKPAAIADARTALTLRDRPWTRAFDFSQRASFLDPVSIDAPQTPGGPPSRAVASRA